MAKSLINVLYFLLTGKECPLYAAPKNGALACVKIGNDRSCAVMCKSGYDFVFNPPMFYYCVIDQWNFYSLSGFPSESQLPWPDCSSKLIISARFSLVTRPQERGWLKIK